IIGKRGLQRRQLRRRISGRQDGLGRPHFVRLFLAEETVIRSFELAVIELQLHPFGHVHGAGVNRTCRRCVVEVLEINHLQLSVDALMREGIVVAGLERGIAQRGVVHSQRYKNVFANVVFPALSSYGGNDLAGSDVHQVVISVMTAEAGGGLHEAQFVDDLVARVSRGWKEEQVALPSPMPLLWVSTSRMVISCATYG